MTILEVNSVASTASSGSGSRYRESSEMIVRALLTVMAYLSLLVLHQSAYGRPNDAIRIILAGEPISIAQDKGYAVVRLQARWKMFDVVIMRVPSEAEMEQYETNKRAAYAKAGKNAGPYEKFQFAYSGSTNLWSLQRTRGLMDVPDGKMVLAEVPPGEYVVYGQGYGRFLYECFCLGTVGFTIKPGVVTDLGTFMIDYAWEPSSVPELASVTGLGSTAKIDYGVFAVGLRPPNGREVPVPGVAPAQVEAAHFSAVGPFVENNAMLVTRLAPIPGVLAYDGGRVIDVATGKEQFGN